MAVSVLNEQIDVGPDDKNAAAAAARLRLAATEEIRVLAARLSPNARLARTHGTEVVSVLVPLNVKNAPTISLLGDGGHAGEKAGAAAATVGDDVGVASPPTAMARHCRPVLVVVGELVEGGSLRERVVRARQSSEATAVGGALRRRQILADVAEGLSCLHGKGLEHGALSSENVLLDAVGRAKVRARVAAAMAAERENTFLIKGSDVFFNIFGLRVAGVLR